MKESLTPQLLLDAYAQGFFPMAETAEADALDWYCPDPRGIIPLDAFHIPRSFQKFLRSHPFTLRINTSFAEVMQGCAKRDATWINTEIIALYTALHTMGHAHSVEVWRGDALLGGLYGVSIGGAFFGESMFSRAPGTSKLALVHLVERLRAAGYSLLDTQYVNPHLEQFGCIAIRKRDYMNRLESALNASPNPSSRFCTTSV